MSPASWPTRTRSRISPVPLFCQGVNVITDGELVELGRRVPYTSPTLTAMAVGGADVTPDDAFRILDIDLRLAALADDRAHDLLDRGLDRLQAAFPEVLTA